MLGQAKRLPFVAIDPEKADCFALLWFRDNLGEFSALVVLAQHVGPRLNPSMATKGSLLACPSTGVFLELVGDLLKLCGGYLILDMLMDVLRRSGKNFPTTYEERHKNHKPVQEICPLSSPALTKVDCLLGNSG